VKEIEWRSMLAASHNFQVEKHDAADDPWLGFSSCDLRSRRPTAIGSRPPRH
jgi:hypothetical protein